MLWYTELAIEFALLVRLCWRPDGLRWFQCLIGADFAAQLLQMASERLHYIGLSSHVWYIGVAVEVPLIALALGEARRWCDYDGRVNWWKYGTLLHWWIAVTFGLAWVRIFPYTGTALLVVNSLFFTAWFMLSLEK